MNINEVFKKYPQNEPNYNGINYLCIIKINNDFVYSFEYFNNDAEWDLKEGISVVAFVEIHSKKILENL